MGSPYWSLGSPQAGTEENNQATGGMKWGDPRTQGSPASLQGYSGPSSVHQPISREPAAGLIRGDPRAQGAQGHGGPSLLHQPISREPAAGLIRGDPRTQGAPITQGAPDWGNVKQPNSTEGQPRDRGSGHPPRPRGALWGDPRDQDKRV